MPSSRSQKMSCTTIAAMGSCFEVFGRYCTYFVEFRLVRLHMHQAPERDDSGWLSLFLLFSFWREVRLNCLASCFMSVYAYAVGPGILIPGWLLGTFASSLRGNSRNVARKQCTVG